MLLPSLRTLLILHFVFLGHVVLNVAASAAGLSIPGWAQVNDVVGVLEGIAMLVALVWLYKERRASAGAEQLQAALALSAIDLLLSLYFAWQTFFSSHSGGGSIWIEMLLPILIGNGATLLLWLALAPIANERGEETSGMTAIVLPLIGVRVAIWLGRAAFTTSLFHSGDFESAMRWLRLIGFLTAAMGIAVDVLFVLLLLKIIERVGSGALVAPANAPLESAPIGGRGRDLAVGAIWLGVGVLITAVSYSVASSGSGSGRYFISYGAIAVGIGRIVRSFTRKS